MRDTKPLLIILLSVGLVGTWIYHLYDKTQYSNRIKEVFVKDSAAIADAVRDSLHSRYVDTIRAMDNLLTLTETGNDSLKNELDIRFNEINDLRNQINGILGNKTSNRGDLNIARKKISELQQRVDELNGANNSIEEEKTRLNTRMEELTQQIDGLKQNIQSLNDENQAMAEQIKLTAVFVASEINLNAMDIRPNREVVTSQAKKADKIVASFMLQNPIHEYRNEEVIIVVVQPDGKVLQNSDWDAGSFETKNQGTKSFTRKVKFDYTKGEQKQILFSLDVDKFQKGTYTMQIWHRGIMIGQSAKTLN